MGTPEILETVLATEVAPAPSQGGRTFPCRQCGADLVLKVGGERLRCEHCGFEQPLTVAAGAAVQENDLNRALANQVERRRAGAHAAPGQVELRCGSCGATVTFDGTLTSTACSFCGVPIQRQDAHQAADRIPVDGVLPFAIEAGAARQSVAAWVKGRWFAPGEWKRRGVGGDVQGVYLPFFTFDAMTSTEYRGERGEHYTVKVGEGANEREETRTSWSRASGSFQHFFDDVIVAGFRSLPAKLLEALAPWPLARCLPFTPEALAGKLAHSYDLELDACFAQARQKMGEDLRIQAELRIGGDEQRIHHIQTGYAGLTFKHLLLPVWLMAYRHGKKTYRVTVNACTGEVIGERPWSAVKITFLVLAIVGVLALLL